MRDPFPIPAPQWLTEAVRPLADKMSLPTLPLHIHEVLLAIVFYQTVNAVVAPALSRRFFPQAYSSFSYRTRLNWDVHVVSMVQSLLVNTTALWIMYYDTDRNNMNWAGKIWGYDGALGFLQSLAGGYFMSLHVYIPHQHLWPWHACPRRLGLHCLLLWLRKLFFLLLPVFPLS
jgi:hypothetical protein